MKIAEVSLWRFRCFGVADAADGPATPKPLKVDLDSEITALIGRNGSGKSALLAALLRLFGETREERSVRQEDFFVAPGETLDSQQKRQLFVEVRVVFPELAKGAKGRKDGEKTIPSAFRHLIVDAPKGLPFARIRLEATWELSGALDGLIEENVYWLLTDGDVPFGEPTDASIKQRMSASDRAAIVMRYIPASRDVTTLTKLTVRSLGRSLMQSVVWEHKDKIGALLKEATAAFDSEKSLDRINEAINKCWTELNTADTETKARISVLPPDFQQIIRAASVILEPSPTGRTLGFEDLSDGQRSLFHFALVKSLLDFKLALEAEVAAGKKPPFHANFMRAPALTLFAFEEPENHLASFFLSRLMTELQTLSKTQRVQGVVTSHSPSIVGRLEPRALRHLRRNRKTGIAGAAKLVLPEGDDEAAKFVREAVRAHPEIYFARHAIFGEGASEEIVLPRLAEAMGVPIDRSFVAIVPIGGRHVEHFWRLVSQLGIPHTTLLDFDLGRSSGDIAQFKALANALLKIAEPLDGDDKKNIDTAAALGDRGGWGGKDDWNDELIAGWIEFFETRGVFFSAPLDLDMLMLEAFPAAYQKLPADKKGPQKPDDAARQDAAADRVLGDGGFGKAAYKDSKLMPLFPWYSYLFMGDRGKPAVHLGALSQLEDLELDLSCPPVLDRLIKRVKQELERSGE